MIESPWSDADRHTRDTCAPHDFVPIQFEQPSNGIIRTLRNQQAAVPGSGNQPAERDEWHQRKVVHITGGNEHVRDDHAYWSPNHCQPYASVSSQPMGGHRRSENEIRCPNRRGGGPYLNRENQDFVRSTRRRTTNRDNPDDVRHRQHAEQ